MVASNGSLPAAVAGSAEAGRSPVFSMVISAKLLAEEM
jgi:hypothetical protein